MCVVLWSDVKICYGWAMLDQGYFLYVMNAWTSQFLSPAVMMDSLDDTNSSTCSFNLLYTTYHSYTYWYTYINTHVQTLSLYQFAYKTPMRSWSLSLCNMYQENFFHFSAVVSSWFWIYVCSRESIFRLLRGKLRTTTISPTATASTDDAMCFHLPPCFAHFTKYVRCTILSGEYPRTNWAVTEIKNKNK